MATIKTAGTKAIRETRNAIKVDMAEAMKTYKFQESFLLSCQKLITKTSAIINNKKGLDEWDSLFEFLINSETFGSAWNKKRCNLAKSVDVATKGLKAGKSNDAIEAMAERVVDMAKTKLEEEYLTLLTEMYDELRTSKRTARTASKADVKKAVADLLKEMSLEEIIAMKTVNA